MPRSWRSSRPRRPSTERLVLAARFSVGPARAGPGGRREAPPRAFPSPRRPPRRSRAPPRPLGVGPGATVVIPSVCYPTYEVGALLAGATVVRSDSLLALGPTPRVRLVWINSPGNPHGRVLPPAHVRKVISWARERGAVVASD